MNLIATKPDICIAIHHDASTSSTPNGFGAFHSTLFSHDAAKFVYNSTIAKNIYDASAKNNRNRFDWHYYFVARVMTSSVDYNGIASASVNKLKAEALCKGVADYFLSIRHNLPIEDDLNSSSSVESSSSIESSSTVDSSLENSSNVSSQEQNTSSNENSSENTTTELI